MKKHLTFIVVFLVLIIHSCIIAAQENDIFDATVEYSLSKGEVRVLLPDIIMRGLETKISIEFIDIQRAQNIEGRNIHIILNKKHIISQVNNSKIVLPYTFQNKEELKISFGALAIMAIKITLSIV